MRRLKRRPTAESTHVPPTPLDLGDRRDALAFAHAFHQGRGDDAEFLFEIHEDPVRLLVATADMFGAFVREVALLAEMPEADLWTLLFQNVETAVPFTREKFLK